MAFDAVQERDGIVGALLVRHAAALTADRDDRLRALIRHRIDLGAQVLLELIMHLGVDDAVSNVTGPAPASKRLEPVLAQRRPVGRVDEIETVAAEPRGLAAHVVERELRVGAEVDAPQPLLDAAFSRDPRLRAGAAGLPLLTVCR